MEFTESFSKFTVPGDSITTEIDGLTYTARIEHDVFMGPPWEEHDGHGPVSDWTTRDSEPGERILTRDSGHVQYYNYIEALKIAYRDGWDAPPYGGDKTEQAIRAVNAVNADFSDLQAWCNDEWCWVGIVISISIDDIVLSECATSVWGVDCNHPRSDNGHLTEMANELLSEAVDVGRQLANNLRARLEGYEILTDD